MSKAKYTEPEDFIPKEIRKKLGLGEFNKEEIKIDEKKQKENKSFRDYMNEGK